MIRADINCAQPRPSRLLAPGPPPCQKLARGAAAVAAGAMLVGGGATAQQRDFSQVEITATRVSGNIFMLQGAGGNIGVSVGPDGILIVDDQFAPLAAKIREALGKLGEGKLKFVLNTHWHGDHTGGNQEFGREVPIIAHANVRKRLQAGLKVPERTVPAAPREALPVVTFDDSLSVWFNGEEIRALHYPHGHTDGDTVIFFTGSNVIHMGDDFFSGRYPFVDLDSGGDVEGYASNVKAVLAKLPVGVKIIPGHGPLSTAEDLKKFDEMLTESLSLVRSKIAAGKSLEQIQQEGMPEKWKGWEGEFVSAKDWLGIVHRSLTHPVGASGR